MRITRDNSCSVTYFILPSSSPKSVNIKEERKLCGSDVLQAFNLHTHLDRKHVNLEGMSSDSYLDSKPINKGLYRGNQTEMCSIKL